MADHLPLPPGRALESRRAPNAPIRGSRARDRSEHAAGLKGSLHDISELAGVDDEDEAIDPRLVLKIRGATRISEGPFSRMEFQVLGEGDDWTYAVLTGRQSRNLFRQLLDEYSDTFEHGAPWSHPQNLATAIDNIIGVELYRPEDRLDPELGFLSFAEPEIVDISLWPAPSLSMASERVSDIEALLTAAAQSGSVAEAIANDARPQTTMIRARVDRATLSLLSLEGWIERIRPQISTGTTLRDILRASAPESLPPMAREPIGVLDGVVVETNPLISGRVARSNEFPVGHVFRDVDTHGTAVASLAMWGNLDFVLTKEPRVRQGVPIVSARVLDVDQKNRRLVVAGQAHVTFEQALRWMKDEVGIRVVSISINRDLPEAGLLRSELTSKLDELARELDLVVVVSAGNRDTAPATGWMDQYPNYLLEASNEVTPPGDAALALTVGASCRRDVPSTEPRSMMLPVAPLGGPAPFTRTGPVRNHLQFGRAKPELSADGGNLVVDSSSARVIRDDAGVSVPVATPPAGGQILSTEIGTSYSAPAVAYEVALIAHRYPDASANSLRALLRRSEVGGLDGLFVV